MFLVNFLIFLSAQALVKVAVVDTGFNKTKPISLCDTNYSITSSTADTNGHGTNVSYAIDDQIEDKSQYCQVIVKVFNGAEMNVGGYLNSLRFILKDETIKIVNLSIEGSTFIMEEYKIISKLLDAGKVVIVSAGNQRKDLSKNCTAFPACIPDKRIVVVGNKDELGKISMFSNKNGPVDVYEEGNFCHGGKCLLGTSQSAAIITGKIINRVIKTKKYGVK